MIKENQYHISVRDNGIGISKKHQSEVFSMFKRFHPKVSFGSGLGLYLVKKNMKAMDGEVHCKALEDGTNFSLSFPYQKSHT